jgi:hypothetical protein
VHGPSVTYHASALGPLRNVAWTIPVGVSAVVGPNRVGKSTLLKLPDFVRLALEADLETAVRDVFKGSAFLRNFTLPPTAECSVGLSLGAQSNKLAWTVELSPLRGSVARFPAERLSLNQEIRAERKLGDEWITFADEHVKAGTRLLPGAALVDAADIKSTDELLERLIESAKAGGARAGRVIGILLAATAMKNAAYRTYEYQIQHLLRYGSVQSSATTLQSSGENVFPLLRNWRDQSELEPRFEFVMDSLREAFPQIQKLDFESSGQTVTVATIDQRWKTRTPIAFESTGLITALLQLCAVASVPANGLVTIDELETSLHPHAIRVLIAAFRRWAKEHNLRIVLATQSETVLDQFRDEPENIFVMEAKQETSPQPLTEMFGADWLKQFSLGDLFSHLEFGAPDLPQD